MAIADNAPEKSPFECAVLKHDIIFARSVDNNFYAAVVTDTNESNVAAEFLSGGRTNVSKTEIRPISPGCQVEVFVKADDEDEGDWQDATIVSFDAKAGTVSVNLDGKLDTTSIKYVRVGGEAFDWEIAPPSGLLDSSLFKFWLPVCIYLVLTYVYMQPMGLKVTVIV